MRFMNLRFELMMAAIKYSSGMRYHATSQAVVERFNQTLRNMIKRYVASGTKDWPNHLQQFVGNYNSNRPRCE